MVATLLRHLLRRLPTLRAFAMAVAISTATATAAADCASNDSLPPIRPVTSAYMIEAGSAHLADIYLSPLKYSGWHLGLSYDRRQAMKFDPARWVMQLSGDIGISRTLNPARNATMWDLMLHLSWGMSRRWHLPHSLTLYAGGSTSLNAGCLYSARNGNNPASAKGAWTVNVTAAIAWHTRLRRIPLTLCYQPTLPFTGIFFAPDYGELYYEIYLGDRSGLVHGAWWGNYFKLDNLLTADLQLGATMLRIGYRCDIISTHVEHTTTRIVTHSAVLGVVSEWLSLHPGRRPDPTARIISASY